MIFDKLNVYGDLNYINKRSFLVQGHLIKSLNWREIIL